MAENKPIGVISYEDRVAKMEKPGDEDEQLRLAKEYMKRMRRKAKAAGTLDAKLRLYEAQKEAEAVVRQLRLHIFELEDMLRAKMNGEVA